MKIIINILLVSTLLIVNGCGVSTSNRKKETPSVSLLNKLNSINSEGILFGHQDDLAYGIDWKYKGGDKLDSDVKRATKQYPAVLGWDIGRIGDSLNIDGVSFEHMKKLMIKGDSMGAVNTISWHPFFLNDSISSWDKKSDIAKTLVPGGKNHKELIDKLNHFTSFLNSLKRLDGSLVPIIFRPWHEMNGNWFWWGENFCENEIYKKLFQFTVDYLRVEKGLDNLLIAYSPDRKFYSEADYLKWYPGDEYIDILGVDNYWDFKPDGEGIDAVIKKLEIVVSTAEKKNKLAAFTETGYGQLEKEKWYSQDLLKVLTTNKIYSKLSYVVVWRNQDTTHFYLPYKSHPAFNDFKKFASKKEILFLDDFFKKLNN